MFDAKALRHEMLDNDCSMRELAKVCGISPSALYRRMSGKVEFTLGEIVQCVDRLNLSAEERNRIFFAEKVS